MNELTKEEAEGLLKDQKDALKEIPGMKGEGIPVGESGSNSIYKEVFSDEKKYLEKLDNLLSKLCEKIEYMNQLVK